MSHAQLPLALRFPPDQRLERFVGADEALAGALGAFARGEASGSLYLHGPPGSGKSHLGLALCAEASALGRGVAYLPLAALAGRLREALEGQESAQLLVLDGVDAIAGHADDELALFDVHNRARDRGTLLVYTGSCEPMGLPLALPDLRSRLAQSTRFALGLLDDEGRREVLRRRAQARGLVLDEAVLDWLLARQGRDLRTLGAVLDRLDRASLAHQRRITVPFVRGLLASGEA